MNIKSNVTRITHDSLLPYLTCLLEPLERRLIETKVCPSPPLLLHTCMSSGDVVIRALVLSQGIAHSMWERHRADAIMMSLTPYKFRFDVIPTNIV